MTQFKCFLLTIWYIIGDALSYFIDKNLARFFTILFFSLLVLNLSIDKQSEWLTYKFGILYCIGLSVSIVIIKLLKKDE
jgi:hypothetical protein